MQQIEKKRMIVKDRNGVPNYMTAFFWNGPKDPKGAPPMFVVRGRVMDAVLISQFFNTRVDSTACSLPYTQPWVRVTMDEADAACRLKGIGWHLMTNTEYAFLLKESRALGTEPHGNTDYGRDHDHPDEKGHNCGKSGATLNGLDPVTWSHDHTEGGVYGLKGNLWEMVQGLRLSHGRVQYIRDNDAAHIDTDAGPFSPEWIDAKTADGRTIKLSAGINVTVTAEEAAPGFAHDRLRSVKNLLEEKDMQILYDLEVLPPDWKKRKEMVYVDSGIEEAIPFRGSSFLNPSYGGVSAVYLNSPRTHVNSHFGFRSALYVEDRKLITE